jgi:hypothetical protein
MRIKFPESNLVTGDLEIDGEKIYHHFAYMDEKASNCTYFLNRNRYEKITLNGYEKPLKVVEDFIKYRMGRASADAMKGPDGRDRFYKLARKMEEGSKFMKNVAEEINNILNK